MALFKKSEPLTPEEVFEQELGAARDEERRLNGERHVLHEKLELVLAAPERLRADFDASVTAGDRPAAIEAKKALDEHPVDLALARARYQSALAVYEAARIRVQQIEDRPKIEAQREAHRAALVAGGYANPDGSPRVR